MTEVFFSDEVQNAVRTVLTRLNQLNRNHTQHVMVTVDNGPKIHTTIQTLFNFKFEKQIERVVYELIMTHAIAAEKLGPGGFSCFLELFNDYSDRPSNVFHDRMPRHCSSSDLKKIIDLFVTTKNVFIKAMLQEALRLAGFAGKIIIEKTSSSVPSVELVYGFSFDLSQVLPIDFNFKNPRIVCIDGYVESVSEVHHLLEGASEAKEPCIVFLRGLSDDVKHTLKVNYDRGSLRVVPIVVSFDLEGMNTLVDIAVVSGCDVVSSLKGDLISNIKFDELPKIAQASMFRNRVALTSSKNARRVKQHVNQLKTRRSNETINDDVGKLLDKRIRSLTPNHVVIRLPDDNDFVINSQAIDYALRGIKSAIEHGVNDVGLPVATDLAAAHHVKTCAASLKSLGAVLINA